MAIAFSDLRKPTNPQVVDPSTGRMREEWQLYFDGLTKRLNGTVGAAVTGPASSTDGNLAAFADAGGLTLEDTGIASSAVVTLTGSQTLTNKTLTSPLFTGVASPTYAAGKLVYDTDNESLTFFNNEADVSMQVGLELWIRVRNSSGATIANGKAVYISGNHAGSGLPEISLAQANSEATSVVVGLATHDIENNSIGFVCSEGSVRGLNTTGFSNGARLWLSASSAGDLVTTIPSAPNFRVRVGVCTRSNASSGVIYCDPAPVLAGYGTANQVAGMNNGATGIEYKTLSGTANEITVTHAANSVTYSIPTSVTFTGKTITGGTYSSVVRTTYAAGTNAIPPVKFTAGTNLTTAEAGALEYDGAAFYASPAASNRAVNIATHFLSLSANQTGSNANTAQPWFPGGGATGLTVAGDTTYFFEGFLLFTKTAGISARTVGLNFGGTATITSILYDAAARTEDAANPTLGAVSFLPIAVATNTTVTASSSSANQSVSVRVKGMVRINAGGTFIPNFQYSAAPGGAPTIRANSWFKMTPVGSGSVLHVGNWV